MIDLTKLFGFSKDEASEHGSLFHLLTSRLSSHSESEVVRVTAIAGLLGKVACSEDGVCSREEQQISEVLNRHLGLCASNVGLITELVVSQTKELAGIEDYRYARLVNDFAQKEEKLEILDLLFEVAAADGGISSTEDYALGTIATALRLTRQTYLDARLKHRDSLTVIQNLPGNGDN